jgi:hypothetical protein
VIAPFARPRTRRGAVRDSPLSVRSGTHLFPDDATPKKPQSCAVAVGYKTGEKQYEMFSDPQWSGSPSLKRLTK